MNAKILICVFLSLFALTVHAMNWFYMNFLFCALSFRIFIDSLCRQSVDIGYYYYSGFVVCMPCCELISIGYFFLCLFAHLFLIHVHFIRIGMRTFWTTHLSVGSKFSTLQRDDDNDRSRKKYVKHFSRTNYPCQLKYVTFVERSLIVYQRNKFVCFFLARMHVKTSRENKFVGQSTFDLRRKYENCIYDCKFQCSNRPKRDSADAFGNKQMSQLRQSVQYNFHNSIKICVDCVTIIVTRMLCISACPILCRCCCRRRRSVANAMPVIASWCAQQLLNFQPRTIFLFFSV